jgi:hypothetical protein
MKHNANIAPIPNQKPLLDVMKIKNGMVFPVLTIHAKEQKQELYKYVYK